MSAQEWANGISYSGHTYAMTRAGRHLTPAGDLQETFGGMEQVLTVQYSIAVISSVASKMMYWVFWGILVPYQSCHCSLFVIPFFARTLYNYTITVIKYTSYDNRLHSKVNCRKNVLKFNYLNQRRVGAIYFSVQHQYLSSHPQSTGSTGFTSDWQYHLATHWVNSFHYHMIISFFMTKIYCQN